jgi:predicted nucleotidyltransferase
MEGAMLDDLFGSKTRASVLTALVQDPSRPLHLRELVRRAGGSVSGVQREVERLLEMGLIRSQRGSGGTREFVLEPEHPFADPLAGLIAAEARAAYAPCPVDTAEPGLAPLLNPHIRGLAGPIVDIARRHGAHRVALFGSATQADVAVVPADLDVAVSFSEQDDVSRAEQVFGLKSELERISGMPVDLVEPDAVDNPYLREQLERMEVVLYQAQRT